MIKSKKILVIGLTERMGGVETFIRNTTIFSDKKKYEYEYLIHGTENPIFKEDIEKFYGKSPFHFVGHFKRKPISTFWQLAKFYKLNHKKYDFIHLQTGATSELCYVFPFNFLYKIPLISHSHNGNGYAPVINSLFKGLLNLSTKVRISCSDEATRWLFGERYIKSTKILNNGIDVERFKFNEHERLAVRANYSIGEDSFVIGHIGRFSDQKNHKKIVSIFKEILLHNPSAKLLLVGVGELQDEIKQLVTQVGMEQSVIFAGKQSNTEAYYSAFDVFLMPSLYEGLPIVGIEAQSMGLPCFFSNTIDSQIKLTDNTHIVDLDASDKEWANTILKNIKCKERKKYPQIISEKGFSIQQTVKELEEIYKYNDEKN